MTKERCPFCDRIWKTNLCVCGAYAVIKGYEHLPYNKQPYKKTKQQIAYYKRVQVRKNGKRDNK